MLLCRSEPRRNEDGDNKRKEQSVDDDADNRWRENTSRALLRNTEQSDNAKHQAEGDEAKRTRRNHRDRLSRHNLAAEYQKDEGDDGNNGADPTEMGCLARERLCSGCIHTRVV